MLTISGRDVGDADLLLAGIISKNLLVFGGKLSLGLLIYLASFRAKASTLAAAAIMPENSK